MSRHYRMEVEISGFSAEKEDDIIEACCHLWNFDRDSFCTYEDPISGKLPKLVGDGEDNLCGGEGETEFAKRLTGAVWRANGGACTVDVAAWCLEDLPYNLYSFDENDYAEGDVDFGDLP